MYKRALLGVAACVFWIQLGSAQTTGIISGMVRDSSGGVVPGAAVVVKNVETGLTRTLSTDAQGRYQAPSLSVGQYEVEVSMTGFQTEIRSGIGLTVGQEAVVNFALSVGQVAERVEVTAEAPLVNTTSGSLGALVNEQQVAELPLKGRNYAELTLLQPGVTQLRHQGDTSLTNTGTRMSINGAPPRSNYFLLDGAPIGNVADSSAASVASNTLGVEGIREWRVVTNSFSAEYGMRMGSQMTIVSKGGTNSFHGSLFEYLRNSALDARNFFDYPTAATPPDWRLQPFRRNQFGGSAGGPIKKDKLFAFGTYEQLKERLGITTLLNVMAAGCHGAAGATITNAACPQLGNTASVTIPPVIAPLLALYPIPNLPGNRYTFPFTQPTDEHYGQVRGDYNFSASDSAFVRYTIDDGQQVRNIAYPQFTLVGTSRSQLLTASESHTFGSAMVGTFRFSYGRPRLGGDTVDDLLGPQYSFVAGQTIGQISIGGVTPSLGPNRNTPQEQRQSVFSYSGDLFYTKGRHSLKFGTLVNHYHPTTLVGGAPRGSISFTNIASFLQARTSSYSALTPGSDTLKNFTFDTWGFYLQDDLRVRSNLTLNLGLRYEFHNTLTETAGRFSALRNVWRDEKSTVGPNFLNPSLKNISPRFGFAWDVKGDGKTAVRGGFGLLYDVGAWGQAVNMNASSQQPFASASSNPTPGTLTSLPLVFTQLGKNNDTFEYHIKNPHLLSYNFTVERQLPFQTVLSLAYAGSRGLNLLGTPEANPPIPHFLPDGRFYYLTGDEPRPNPNFVSIQQVQASQDSWYNSLQFLVSKRLSKGLQFQSSYTWSKLMDDKAAVGSGDAVSSGNTGEANALLPQSLDLGLADYHIAHNWRFNAIYRLPEVSGLKGIPGTLLSGWWMSGILTAQTGSPFTPNTTGDRALSQGSISAQHPDLALDSRNVPRNNGNITQGVSAGCDIVPSSNFPTGKIPAGTPLGTPNLYFDPCAFSLPAAGFVGTAGRNFLIGPGNANLAFSLVKDTRLGFLGEGGNLEFRAEIFNILNRANFSNPSLSVFPASLSVLPASSVPALSTAGNISGADTSRQVQLALKVIW